MELSLARLGGNHEAVREAADRLLATASRPGRRRRRADPRAGSAERDDVRAVAGAAHGLVALAEGELPAARTRFAEAREAARRAGRPRTELLCVSRSAALEAARGALRAAEELAGEALAMPACQGWSARSDCGYAYLALALVAWHRDRPAEAVAHLALAGPAAAEPGGAALAALCRAGLLADGDDPGGALRTLAGARAVAPGAELGGWLAAEEAQVRAAAGDADGARALLDATGDGPAPALASARLLLRAGDARAAERTLPDWAGPGAADWPLPVRLGAGLLDAVLAGGVRGRPAGRAGCWRRCWRSPSRTATGASSPGPTRGYGTCWPRTWTPAPRTGPR